MEIRSLQAALNARGINPPLLVDGLVGKATMRAIDALLGKDKVKGQWQDWSDARRLIAAEQLVLRESAIETGAIDGLIGEQTRYARSVYAARLKGDSSVETWRDQEQDKSVPVSPFTKDARLKWPRQSECMQFYGPVGSNQVTLELPFPMRIAWEPGRSVTKFSCHAKVSGPLHRIFQRTLDHYGFGKLKELRLDLFGGCLNVRKMRGGSAWSMHSWGIAVDLDPDRNQLKFKRAQASFDDPVYKPFWRFVYDEGAISLGIERDYDWMHFQFARL